MTYRGGCAKGMPRVGACHRRCLHRAMVEDSSVANYQLEDADYRAAYPPPTFKAWLLSLPGRYAREEVAS